MEIPKKKDYRQRAHANPFNDQNFEYPFSPSEMDWTKYFVNGKSPEFLDIGCGYGSFLLTVARKYPEKNILGLEIRQKVVSYVQNKITAHRYASEEYGNAGAILTNALKFMPNFFLPNSISKIFILFPDPHFKKKKKKARIVCKQMLDLFVYFMMEDGRLYIATDVNELYTHMVNELESHPMFKELKNKKEDDLYLDTFSMTDESRRAAVKTGSAFATIYEVKKESKY
ncbi:tRNA (guanine-N(7)-)-methyltransferase [Astathelohania contejeani]|uniref:tRNA (guanine-N(7)-)-methyltransferase n=1 Tax=Astathelohania contejeani TaxID=164912 RepID=A0ABQ7HVX4_9MICR|nr:tRNA (guanine-N(7)-)-methyltransferase [Thelohania contejeani]